MTSSMGWYTISDKACSKRGCFAFAIQSVTSG